MDLIANSLPIEKAMNANAISLINPSDLLSAGVINPSYPLKINPRDGPKSRPNTRYPLTLGNLNFLANNAPTNPIANTIASLKIKT